MTSEKGSHVIQALVQLRKVDQTRRGNRHGSSSEQKYWALMHDRGDHAEYHQPLQSREQTHSGRLTIKQSEGHTLPLKQHPEYHLMQKKRIFFWAPPGLSDLRDEDQRGGEPRAAKVQTHEKCAAV